MMKNNLMKLLLGLCLVSAIVEACLLNSACSGNGACVSFSCVCNQGWTGDDCSIEIVPVNSGQTVTQTLGDRKWIYYDITTQSADSAITFAVTQSNVVSDCDLYIQKDSFPSKSDYSQKDSSRDLIFDIRIEDPGSHVWYAGMYGFFDCSFSMTVTVEAQPTCPNQCSGQGTCIGGDVCSCNIGYTGNDCSTPIIALNDGVTISNHINLYSWEYFYFNSVEVSGSIPSFTVIINQTNPGEGDSDLYISFGKLPSLFQYDFRDATIQENYALTIGSPQVGTYYIGMYGYRACTYSIKLTVQGISNCDDHCSNHGTCVDDVCHCSGPFSGSKCETMTSPLTDGISVNGYVDNNQWNYFYADTQTSNNMIIQMHQVGSGDCDVYIKANDIPTKTSFDLRDIGFSTNFNLTILNPLGNVWHIGVFGYRSCNFDITEFISKSTCPNNCNGNGVCSNSGRCSCNSGFAGNDCGSPLYRIHSGELVTGTVNNNHWIYYKYTAPSVKSSITVELLETSSQGYLWLYLAHAVPPSQSENDMSDTTHSASHTLHELIDNSNSDSDYYIGVYGSPFLPLSIPCDFQIIVYSPAI